MLLAVPVGLSLDCMVLTSISAAGSNVCGAILLDNMSALMLEEQEVQCTAMNSNNIVELCVYTVFKHVVVCWKNS